MKFSVTMSYCKFWIYSIGVKFKIYSMTAFSQENIYVLIHIMLIAAKEHSQYVCVQFTYTCIQVHLYRISYYYVLIKRSNILHCTWNIILVGNLAVREKSNEGNSWRPAINTEDSLSFFNISLIVPADVTLILCWNN